MLRLCLALVMGGASTACLLAAFGWMLYAGHPDAPRAAQIFAGWGFLSGLAFGGLHLYFHGQPAPTPAGLPADALASLVRATLDRAAAERLSRPGSAADRRPTGPAPVPAPVREAAADEVTTP